MLSTNGPTLNSHDQLRRRHFVCLFCCVCLAGLGCQTDEAQQPVLKENAVTEGDLAESNMERPKIEVTANPVDSGTRNTTVSPAVTRQELQLQLQRYKQNGQWHFGERVGGELAGTWRTVKGHDHPIVFGADGSYSEDFNGNMTQGLYAISDTGRVVAFSRWNGIGLGAHYQLDGKTLTGPNGPNPSERWVRSETGK